MANDKRIEHSPSLPAGRGFRRDRQSIDLRGFHEALTAIARANGVTVASLLRSAIQEWLERASSSESHCGLSVTQPSQPTTSRTKVTLRLPVEQALALANAAREACVPQGVYVAKLLASCPPSPAPPDLRENRAVLVRSNASLAALAFELRLLIETLRFRCTSGSVSTDAQISRLGEAVAHHLELTAPLVAALQPFARASAACSVAGPVAGVRGAQRDQGDRHECSP